MEVLVVGESDHLQIGAGSGERCDEGDDGADDDGGFVVLWVGYSRLGCIYKGVGFAVFWILISRPCRPRVKGTRP